MGRNGADRRRTESVTKQQAAPYLQLSLPMINNYRRPGLLRTYKPRGGRLGCIKQEELLALLEEVPW